jgi:phosphatidylserine/phosphatidylglycerophosphate/cardiolipin synthase-like enzyme
MIYSKGALATDAYKDFISNWIQEGDSEDLLKHTADLNQYQQLLKSDYLRKTRGKALYTGNSIRPEMACRFISERPKLGIKDIQVLWQELTSINQKELFFSGVKVETGAGSLGEMIKEKSRSGVDTHYLGNGYDSGNGELTMAVNEWIVDLKKGSFSFLAPLLTKFNNWDKTRLAISNQKLYDSLKEKASINVWAYFNFIHYKVWLFDHPGFFIGSANLDQSKFGEISDAGIYCLDTKIHNELKVILLRDRLNSVLYLPKVQK